MTAGGGETGAAEIGGGGAGANDGGAADTGGGTTGGADGGASGGGAKLVGTDAGAGAARRSGNDVGGAGCAAGLGKSKLSGAGAGAGMSSVNGAMGADAWCDSRSQSKAPPAAGGTGVPEAFSSLTSILSGREAQSRPIRSRGGYGVRRVSNSGERLLAAPQNPDAPGKGGCAE
jgi:hypothetical protein